MKTAYFDCFSGISGDMTVGALIDAGADFNTFQSILSNLNLSGYEVSAEKVLKNGISSTSFKVHVTGDQSHRNLNDILAIIEASSFNQKIKNDAAAIFNILARAEASIHGTTIDKIHVKEIRAVDTKIDIC